SMTNIAFKYMGKTATSLYDKVDTEIQDISVGMKMFAKLVKSGIIDTANINDIINYMTIVLTVESETIPSLQGVHFADETGNFFLMRKKIIDGGLMTEIINRRQQPYKHTFIYQDREGKVTKMIDSKDFTFDPRKRPWYVLAKKVKSFAWTDVYPYHLT